MSSNYPVQTVYPFLNVTKTVSGTFTFALVSLAASGTTNRAEIDVDGMEQAIFFIRYVTGSSETNNTCDVKVEFSPDGTNYFQEATEAVATSVITEYQATRTFTGAAANTTYNYRIAIPVADAKKIRLTFTEGGVAADFGEIGALAVLSGK